MKKLIPGLGALRSCKTAVGHPVDVGSGAVFTASIDIEFTGRPALRWRRFYSTASRQSGPLGFGWSTRFGMRAEERDDNICIIGEEGHTHEFPRQDDGQMTWLPYHAWHLRVMPHQLALRDAMERETLLFEKAQHGYWRLVRVVSDDGGYIALRYQQNGVLGSLIQSPSNRILWLRYDAAGRVVALHLGVDGSTGPALVTYAYSERGHLLETRDQGGGKFAYTYDDTGRMLSEQIRSGGTFRFEYDAQGRCVRTLGDGGVQERRLYFHPRRPEVKVQRGTGHEVTYICNRLGEVLETREGSRVRKNIRLGLARQTISPSGAVTTRFFDPYGFLLRYVDSLGRSFGFAVDEQGRGVSLTDPDGGVRQCTYDEHGRMTTLTDPSGASWQFEHDEWGRIICETDPEGRKIQRRYERNSESQEVTDVVYSYACRTDLRGRPVELVRDGLVVATYFHNEEERRLTERDPEGNQRHFIRDPAGWYIQMQDFDGSRWTIDRDLFGSIVARTSAMGYPTRYEVDLERLLSRVTKPGGANFSYVRDSAGRVIGSVGFDGEHSQYQYDLGGNCSVLHRPDGSMLHRLFYQDRYLLSESVVAPGAVEQQELGRYTWTWRGTLASAIGPGSTVVRQHDACGRMIEEQQTYGTVKYSYDRSGKLVRREIEGLPGGPLAFRYDQAGHLSLILDVDGPVQEVQRDPRRRLLQRLLRGGFKETCLCDPKGRLVEQTVTWDDDTLIRRRYSYNALSNLVTLEDSLRGSFSWVYDPDGRIVEASGPNGTEIFIHDADGNIVRDPAGTARYSAGGRLLELGQWTFQYDACGRLVRRAGLTGATSYSYDAKSRLVAVSNPDAGQFQYSYDPLGRRIRKTGSGVDQRWIWGVGGLAAILSAAVKTQFLIGAVNRRPTAFWNASGVAHYVCDHLGRPFEVLVPRVGIAWRGEYRTFGRLIESPRVDTEPGLLLRLPGQIEDPETRLHDNQARIYDPECGRFLTPDPGGIDACLNLYDYPRDPINWIDPNGLSCKNPRLVAEDPDKGWQIYEHTDADGNKVLTVRADCREAFATPKPDGLRDTVNPDAGNPPEAYITPDGNVVVMEGTHRAAAAAQGQQIPPDSYQPHLGGVPGQPGVMEFELYQGPTSGGAVPLKDLPCPPNYPHKW